MNTMKKITILFVLIVGGLFSSVNGQSPLSIGQVLQMIEENNKELQGNSQLAVSRKLEAKADNNLPDPSVSYTHQYGNKEGLGIQGELEVTQAFDFPTVYAQRGKLAKTKAANLDYQQAGLRQQILLNAKELCLDLVLLNKQKELLLQRLSNVEKLAGLYATRLSNGDANVLETNKIDLELLNVKTAVRRNAAAIVQKQQALEALNGGGGIPVAGLAYDDLDTLPPFDAIRSDAFALDPSLLALKSEEAVARQALNVNKSQWLPDLSLGYRLNTTTGGERFNGFIAGVSIPLFSNRHHVRKAKAEVIYSGLKYENASTTTEKELYQLYHQATSLKESMTEYSRLLKNKENLSLLYTALNAGEISMIEYFVEVASLYDSLDNYMQLENDFQKAFARLLKFRL
ncbi:MAG: TolC family protein [Tannerellaceae bacterium]|jgi:outer membrane protein TolC|nr:TolC family protein [Tannerellaceae bacterium]